LVTWQRCHIIVVVVGVGVATCDAPSSFLSVSTPNSPHEQWLAGWVVVLCRSDITRTPPSRMWSEGGGAAIDNRRETPPSRVWSEGGVLLLGG
jgi:hypothetical protein